MLRGATKISLDAKGRMAIPARYRDEINERSEGRVVCTVDLDYCLLIYPQPDWEDLERFEQMANAMQTAADELDISIVWGGDWKTFYDAPHFELDRKEYP